MRTQRVKVSDIHVGVRKRPNINQDVVRTIAASIKEIGLQNPISICFRDGIEIDGELIDGVGCLVAGAHRREALISLGPQYEYVDAIVFDDDIAARKWEISENLHRKDLTIDEREEHIAEWIALTEAKMEKERVSGQVVPKLSGRGRPEGRPEGGIAAASRELGISEKAAQRAVKIASRTPEAKDATIAAGLQNNQSALLEIARAPKEKQVDKVHEIAARKSTPKPQAEKQPEPPKKITVGSPVLASVQAAKEAYFARLDEMKRQLQDEWLSGPEDWQQEYLHRAPLSGWRLSMAGD